MIRIHLFFVLLYCGAALARTPSDEVKKFLKYEDSLIALTHVRVIDGTGAAAVDDRTVILRDGRIASIGTRDAAIPTGARVLDLSGYSVLPGLVGMHDHLMYTASINLDENGTTPGPGFLVTELPFSAPRLYLAAGVTTLRTTGGLEPYTDLNLRSQIDALQIPGPSLDVTGPYLEGPDTFFPQMAVVTEPAQARATVAYWADQGVTSFKAYENIHESVLAAAIKEAHRRKIKVTGHLCAVDYRQAAALGIDNLEHGPVFTDTEFVSGRKHDTCPADGELDESWKNIDINGPQVQALIHRLLEHHVAITSTLPVFAASISSRPLLSQLEMDTLSAESQRSYLAARSRRATRPERAIEDEKALKKEMQFEVAFVRTVGLLLAGPDPTGNGGVLPGFGDHHEVELLVEAGFTPLEAIHIASANGAVFLGRFDRIGSIERGKNADLFVVKGDPSKHIADIENVELVFKDGLAYDAPKLIASVRGMVGIR